MTPTNIEARPAWENTDHDERLRIIREGVKSALVSRKIAELFDGATAVKIRNYASSNGVKLLPRHVASVVARRKPPRTSSHIVRELFRIIDCDPRSYGKISKRAGVHSVTLSNWKSGNNPRLIDFEITAQTVGYRLALVPIPESEQ